jgi:hypothetical protein
MRTQTPRTKASLILVDERIDFMLQLCQTVINMGAYDALHILYLAALTRVESMAITQLLVHCQQLQHMSLIQLEDVGDEVFTQLAPGFRSSRTGDHDSASEDGLQSGCVDALHSRHVASAGCSISSPVDSDIRCCVS